jgi:hypothetical protein
MLLLPRIVLGVFTAQLHNNCRGADHIENSPSVVEACLPTSCLAMDIHITICIPVDGPVWPKHVVNLHGNID